MRQLLLCAALTIIALPALAQPTDPSQIRGKGGFGQYLQQQQQQPQQTQPQQQRQQAAPQDRGNRDVNSDGRRDGNRDYGRQDRDWGRDGRGGERRAYNGPRRDYSGFRDYHRGYNSSRRFRGPAYRRPAGWYDRRWSFGEFLPSLFWSSSYWLNDFDRYDLPPPPYGTVWVQNGRDALLVDRDTGEIISVRYGVFY
jgi:Ni/Co efflux regulator RcnB